MSSLNVPTDVRIANPLSDHRQNSTESFESDEIEKRGVETGGLKRRKSFDSEDEQFADDDDFSLGVAGEDDLAEEEARARAFGEDDREEWGSFQPGKAFVSGDVDEAVLSWCRNACASVWLDTCVMGAILISTVTLSVENPANTLSPEVLNHLVYLDIVLTVGFTCEMFIRIIAMGWWDRTGSGGPPITYDPCYMNDRGNQLDCFVVLTSLINVLIELTGWQLPINMSTLRALRILRVLKALKKIEGIRQILATISHALPHSLNVLGFMAFLFLVSGIIGVQMFRGAFRHSCRYSGADLQAHLDPDKFPLLSNISVEGGGTTVLMDYHPWPQPPAKRAPKYEASMGLGVWVRSISELLTELPACTALAPADVAVAGWLAGWFLAHRIACNEEFVR